ncbi:hypothetical protein [Cryobacterium psychrophilum]|uniref:Uncharacterized protein n=1 Tax=Cryobacterium psychrophilum TaxID=41988 RepID=A0A4Y8KXD1_9MICO|nr:hypothetical protein [Cryobacterium psychrophilum]TFD81656.1 hypothetical protein E3T53_01210 [Cryobacterium psychrophilum]
MAPLIAAASGSVHMDLAVCTLAPGASTLAQRHAFEESWFVLEGLDTASVAHLTFDTAFGSFGMTPDAAPEQKTAGTDGMYLVADARSPGTGRRPA